MQLFRMTGTVKVLKRVTDVTYIWYTHYDGVHMKLIAKLINVSSMPARTCDLSLSHRRDSRNCRRFGIVASYLAVRTADATPLAARES